MMNDRAEVPHLNEPLPALDDSENGGNSLLVEADPEPLQAQSNIASMTDQNVPTDQAYREIRRAFDFFNRELFEGQLPDCLITFQRARGTRGQFLWERFVRSDGEGICHEISLNPQGMAMMSIREILAVVVRQMAHLSVAIKHNEYRTGYFSKYWAMEMETVGLMPSTTGKPGGQRVGRRVWHYVVKGERFDVAADKLIAEGFRITWLDRVADLPDPEEVEADAGREREPVAHLLLRKDGVLLDENNLPDSWAADGASSVDENTFSGGEHQTGSDATDSSVLVVGAPRAHEATDIDAVPLPADGEQVPAAGIGAVLNDEQGHLLAGLPEAEAPKAQQNISFVDKIKKRSAERLLYKCPSCEETALASSSAQLICGKCEQNMARSTRKMRAHNDCPPEGI